MVRAWHGRGMASVNQTRPHCVNQMGKTHSKPLAAWHGRGTACYVWIGLNININVIYIYCLIWSLSWLLCCVVSGSNVTVTLDRAGNMTGFSHYEYSDWSVYIKIEQYPSNTTSLFINPLKPELNPICYLLALLGAHHFLHVSRITVKLLTFRLLMSYIYGAPILDVSRSHTTTQHSR